MSDEGVTVRVPWVVGTVGSASPVALTPADVATMLQEKAGQIADDIGDLQQALAAAAARGDRKLHQALQDRLDFSRRRIGWLSTIAAADRPALLARARALATALGPEALVYLDRGLPDALKADHRMLDLLGELALVRLALGA
jgi:hypothetical protein